MESVQFPPTYAYIAFTTVTGISKRPLYTRYRPFATGGR